MASRFVLEGVDPDTNNVARDLVFEADAARLSRLLDVDGDGIGAGVSYPVEREHLSLLAAELGVVFDAGDLEVWLRAWRPVDSLPYKVHTNRELALMLEGVKPLAVFDVGGNWDGEEEFFGPHVAAGKFIRRQFEDSDGRRQVFYARPGEEWRIDAYIDLLTRSAASGWSEEHERRQGQLLGYEDWQNDAYIETIYRRQIR